KFQPVALIVLLQQHFCGISPGEMSADNFCSGCFGVSIRAVGFAIKAYGGAGIIGVIHGDWDNTAILLESEFNLKPAPFIMQFVCLIGNIAGWALAG
ncbi:hypothetical protein, partial [Endozoicomonas acroporae]|uniref:hypothetical protein n=1 Tax=Endozoicomonas acroporae TaxID=1701104 RepID=UPI001C609083